MAEDVTDGCSRLNALSAVYKCNDRDNYVNNCFSIKCRILSFHICARHSRLFLQSLTTAFETRCINEQRCAQWRHLRVARRDIQPHSKFARTGQNFWCRPIFCTAWPPETAVDCRWMWWTFKSRHTESYRGHICRHEISWISPRCPRRLYRSAAPSTAQLWSKSTIAIA